MNICLQHVSSAGLIPEPEEKAKLRKNWEYLSAGEATEAVRSDCSIGRSCLIKRYCLIRRAHIAQLSDNTPHHCFKLENGKCRFSSEFFSEISQKK